MSRGANEKVGTRRGSASLLVRHEDRETSGCARLRGFAHEIVSYCNVKGCAHKHRHAVTTM